jgi:phosphonate transport system ATP-binding protein
MSALEVPSARELAFDLEHVHVDLEGHPVLHGISCEVRAGESLAIVGPSGAGKSTLLRTLQATLFAARGSVRILGIDVGDLDTTKLRRLRARLGYVPQDFGLVPNLRVISSVISGRVGRWSTARALRALCWPGRALEAEAYAVLESVGIGAKLFQRVDRLSGGERQRVALARALFQGAEAILADEPVSSVDPGRAREALGLLTGLSRERGLTLCVSLHQIELARDFFPRLIGLRSGRVVFDRAPDEVGRAEIDALYRLDGPEVEPP